MIDLLVVGLRKSGTSWLHENVKNENLFGINKNVKETGFFGLDSINEKDLQEYIEGFDPEKKKAEFDASLCYIENYYKNINTYLSKDARVVLILRNPIEYLVSRVEHSYRKGELKSNNLEDAIEVDWVRQEMDYVRILEKFNNIYHEKEIIPFELLRENPVTFYKTVFGKKYENYLTGPMVIEKINASRAPRYRLVTILLSNIAKSMRFLGFHSVVNFVKKSMVQTIFEKTNEQDLLNYKYDLAKGLIFREFKDSYNLWKKHFEKYL